MSKCVNCNFSSCEVKVKKSGNFVWVISQFSTLQGEVISSIFRRIGCEWQLKLHPDAAKRGILMNEPGTGKVRVTLQMVKSNDIQVMDTMADIPCR